MNKPERRICLNIDIDADTVEDAVGELKSLIIKMLHRGEEDIHSVSGGNSTGSIITMKVNPEITHDTFIEELNKYLEVIENEKT
jgi:hypothetical protein